VVGADGDRQPALGEQPLEGRAGQVFPCGFECLAQQQEASRTAAAAALSPGAVIAGLPCMQPASVHPIKQRQCVVIPCYFWR
jgi:hypothetical protein